MTMRIPEPAAGYVRAVNDRDPARLIALFSEDAVVDDAGRQIRGREAIREWAASDIFAANVTFDVRGVRGADGDATVSAKVDGTFDRTGLPDPLIMTFRVVGERGMISGLTCRLADRS
jgi:ketosteroid isomerase-like protein